MIFTNHKIVAMHEAEFEAWEKLLSSLNTAQIKKPLLPDGLFIKNKVAHLAARWPEEAFEVRFEKVARILGETQAWTSSP